ncbi:hypothetical protein F5141DRAFT_1014115 [Pisolithus sp. B1]|nr:hypothetical protein F5141DRAFT_1014115 [Pisolithus sp. B1]
MAADINDNDDKGWVDEVAELTAEEQAGLEQRICPVRLVLAKTCKLAFKIIHSTTILLPTWHATCKETRKKVKQIPHDILTRWNSTFDMINFILEYQEPVDAITDK